jgi:hypothetical protein
MAPNQGCGALVVERFSAVEDDEAEWFMEDGS